tara:strand:+ start:391 stop:591 length:201 start_codon:yes stop_codon:yes gene_type:complete
MAWMKFVYQVSILGDDKLFAKIVDKADKNQKESIQYRGQEIELDKAKAIVSYLDMYNRTTDDLLRR